MAVGVVVATLSAAELVAAQQQRYAGGKKQSRKECPLLPLPQGIHVTVAGRPLCRAVPSPVVVCAVAVVLRVRLVVRAVVRNKVGECEPVGHGAEVHRRTGPTPFVWP